MKLLGFFSTVPLLLVAAVSAFYASIASVDAQDGAEETIAALETEVASLRTQVASYSTPTEEPERDSEEADEADEAGDSRTEAPESSRFLGGNAVDLGRVGKLAGSVPFGDGEA